MYNVEKTLRDLSLNIYFRRKSNHMSARILGSKIARAECTVTSWERGDKTPSLEDILAVCNVFGCTLDEMLSTQMAQ